MKAPIFLHSLSAPRSVCGFDYINHYTKISYKSQEAAMSLSVESWIMDYFPATGW